MKQPPTPRFLLRFDDICPTMRWSIWTEVEKILVEVGVKPILAVVPDNRDEDLMFEPADAAFWARVRAWQERGWTIGLHGYQHRYVTKDAGLFGRVPLSEFAGLPLDVQETKLRNALQIFRDHNVSPELWVAPAHSFDANTITALSTLGMRTISDGYALYPYQDSNGLTWIPQQVGRFRNIPFGVWTICHHINDWTSRDVLEFREELAACAKRFTCISEILQSYRGRQRNWLDLGAAGLLRLGRRAGRLVHENFNARPLSTPADPVCEPLSAPPKSS